MDATKEQPRQSKPRPAFISELLQQPTRRLEPEEIDVLEQQLHELEVIDDFLRSVAPTLAMAEDY